MAHLKNRKKSVALIAAAGVTIAGTGVAFAYWTATGTGEGTATTGSIVGFTIDSSPPVGDPLTPDGTSQTVDFTVTNPSIYAQVLGAVTVTIANADGSPWTAQTGCSADDYTATISAAPAVGSIAPAAEVDGTVTVTMLETNVNQDGCQGAEVPLFFEAATL